MSEIILTIVVPCYNSEEYIEATLESLKCGRHPQVEFILIDGFSTDRTMAIVERFADIFSVIKSEPDNGQSAAFNKGYKIARGKFVTWVNSDDLMNARALPEVVDYLTRCKAEWVVANTAYIDKKGFIMRCCRAGGFERYAVRFGVLNVFGPSTFITKKLYAEVGDFREDFHFCMDTEYWWRIVKKGYRFERIPCYFWGLRLHDNAKTAGALLYGKKPPRMEKEGQAIKQLYYPLIGQRERRIGVLIARLYRAANLSLFKSVTDTIRFKRKPFSLL
jgi:glycosyltransferase involved in cell wall biosynthesis